MGTSSSKKKKKRVKALKRREIRDLDQLAEYRSYYGESTDRKIPEGFGITFEDNMRNKSEYIGYHRDGKRYGPAKCVFDAQHEQYGSWFEDNINGYSIFLFGKGTTGNYKGHFIKGMFEGEGLFEYKTEDEEKYCGYFKGHQKHGFGRYEASDWSYIGEFENDVKKGQGWFSTGNEEYQYEFYGYFDDDQPTKGVGIYKLKMRVKDLEREVKLSQRELPQIVNDAVLQNSQEKIIKEYGIRKNGRPDVTTEKFIVVEEVKGRKTYRKLLQNLPLMKQYSMKSNASSIGRGIHTEQKESVQATLGPTLDVGINQAKKAMVDQLQSNYFQEINENEAMTYIKANFQGFEKMPQRLEKKQSIEAGKRLEILSLIQKNNRIRYVVRRNKNKATGTGEDLRKKYFGKATICNNISELQNGCFEKMLIEHLEDSFKNQNMKREERDLPPYPFVFPRPDQPHDKKHLVLKHCSEKGRNDKETAFTRLVSGNLVRYCSSYEYLNPKLFLNSLMKNDKIDEYTISVIFDKTLESLQKLEEFQVFQGRIRPRHICLSQIKLKDAHVKIVDFSKATYKRFETNEVVDRCRSYINGDLEEYLGTEFRQGELLQLPYKKSFYAAEFDHFLYPFDFSDHKTLYLSPSEKLLLKSDPSTYKIVDKKYNVIKRDIFCLGMTFLKAYCHKADRKLRKKRDREGSYMVTKLQELRTIAEDEELSKKQIKAKFSHQLELIIQELKEIFSERELTRLFADEDLSFYDESKEGSPAPKSKKDEESKDVVGEEIINIPEAGEKAIPHSKQSQALNEYLELIFNLIHNKFYKKFKKIKVINHQTILSKARINLHQNRKEIERMEDQSEDEVNKQHLYKRKEASPNKRKLAKITTWEKKLAKAEEEKQADSSEEEEEELHTAAELSAKKIGESLSTHYTETDKLKAHTGCSLLQSESENEEQKRKSPSPTPKSPPNTRNHHQIYGQKEEEKKSIDKDKFGNQTPISERSLELSKRSGSKSGRSKNGSRSRSGSGSGNRSSNGESFSSTSRSSFSSDKTPANQNEIFTDSLLQKDHDGRNIKKIDVSPFPKHQQKEEKEQKEKSLESEDEDTGNRLFKRKNRPGEGKIEENPDPVYESSEASIVIKNDQDDLVFNSFDS